MADIDIADDGSLRCTVISPSRRPSPADDARDQCADDAASLSPTELLATSLGTCILSSIATAARHRGIDLAGARVSVKKEIVTRPARRINRLTVELFIPHALPDEQRAALQWAAKSSAVYRSIHPDVDVPIVFRWAERTIDRAGVSLAAS